MQALEEVATAVANVPAYVPAAPLSRLVLRAWRERAADATARLHEARTGLSQALDKQGVGALRTKTDDRRPR
jgi:hypothetical protein